MARARERVGAGRALIQAAALLAIVPTARAQQPAPAAVLYMKGLRTGLCVEFLVAPDSVASYFTNGIRPVPVESLAGAYPALARVAQSEMTYAGWIPAEYCWYLYHDAVASGQQIALDGGRRSIGVGYLGVAASGLPDSADKVAVTFFTNSGRLSRILDVSRIRVERIDIDVGPIPDEESDTVPRRYTAKHRGTTIQWDGGPRVPQPAESREVRVQGWKATGGPSIIRTAIVPDSVFSSSGTLKITGKGELRRLLGASPIRLVTKFYRGGDSDWVFGR